jgi:hypothetical protein
MKTLISAMNIVSKITTVAAVLVAVVCLLLLVVLTATIVGALALIEELNKVESTHVVFAQHAKQKAEKLLPVLCHNTTAVAKELWSIVAPQLIVFWLETQMQLSKAMLHCSSWVNAVTVSIKDVVAVK